MGNRGKGCFGGCGCQKRRPCNNGGNENHNRCPKGCDTCSTEDRVSPTNTIYRVTTHCKTVRHIHPQEIVNVNRTIVRNQNFYPVTERNEYETIEIDDNGNNGNNVAGASTGNRFNNGGGFRGDSYEGNYEGSYSNGGSNNSPRFFF